MSHETTRAIQGESGLAGVQWLLSGTEPQAALRSALGALLADPALLGESRLHRAKYKPGRHLTAYYEVAIRAPSGAETVRQVEVIWLPEGAPSPHGVAGSQLPMEDEAQRLGEVAPFLHLAAEEPAWGFWLRVSPLDTKFPQLARLSDPAHVQALLAQIYAPQGGPPAASYGVNVVRYRPGQRHVLRYDPGGRVGKGSLFAKVYNSEKGERVSAVVDAVADRLASTGAGLTTVRPQAYLPEETTLLYPWVEGRPLSQLLQSPGSASDELLARAGAALRALHRTPADLSGLKPHSLAKELKGIASAAEHIHTLLPATGAQIRAILERAEALHERLPQEPPGFAYGDFKADHLWVTDEGLTLIDFDTCYLFDQAIDTGKFLADLRWWYDGYGLAGVEDAQAHFLDGYGATAEQLPMGRLYEVLVLVKTTARRVRLFDRDWEARTARLIGQADGLLHALEATAGVAA
jgi:aminoglycoside phosphotransferase (APT) family kinase protein